MGIRRGGDSDREREDGRRGYRYRPADQPAGDEAEEEAETVEEEEGDLDAELPDDEDEEGGEDDEGDEEERPSEFWPAAEILHGATIEDAELELSYEASVYANLAAAELRLWLRMPDGRRRLVQIDEPHAVWLYREASHSATDFEEYPDHRFELLCSDLRATQARRQRQLIDRQLALHNELVAVGEELEELERDMRENETETANWPGTSWP